LFGVSSFAATDATGSNLVSGCGFGTAEPGGSANHATMRPRFDAERQKMSHGAHTDSSLAGNGSAPLAPSHGSATRLQYRVVSRYATRISRLEGPYDFRAALELAAGRILMGDTSVTIEEIEGSPNEKGQR
jgi:hypothetical protein